MNRPKTLVLSHSDITAILSMPMAIEAVKRVMLAHGTGQVIRPNLLHADAPSGEFHIKTGGVLGELGPGKEGIFGLKANGGFFQNHLHNLPNIIGLITLSDAKTGVPLAVLDSVEISRVRTGAATAVAAQLLARPNSKTATVLGSGNQARTQIEALCQVLPLNDVRVVSRNVDNATQCAGDIARRCHIHASAWSDLEEALSTSDVIITTTPSKKALIKASEVKAGTFIAAIGSDSPGKQELDPMLLVNNKVVADIRSQCIHVGDLQHPISLGLIHESDVYAELGDLLTGKRRGRETEEEITIYDSTGTALQDVAVGLIVYEEALRQGLGTAIQLGA